MQDLVIKTAVILFCFKGFFHPCASESHEENLFLPGNRAVQAELRVAGKSLAQVILKTEALSVCQEPTTELAEVSQTCWPNCIACNNILPVLI